MDSDNILVLQNKCETSDSICIELENAGFTVISATDMGKALQQVVDVKPDVVILHVDHPKTGGIEICRAIVQDNSVHSHVIVISSKNDLQTMLSYFIAGANRFLSKPFHVNDLLCEINNAIRKKKMSSVQMYNAAHD